MEHELDELHGVQQKRKQKMMKTMRMKQLDGGELVVVVEFDEFGRMFDAHLRTKFGS